MQIIRDTREQEGFEFSFYDVEIIELGLPCGDYTTSKLKGKVSVERKRNSGEVYGNLCNKKSKERFYRELDKLKQLDHAIIVFEFPKSYLYSFPEKSGLAPFTKARKFDSKPYDYIKVSAKYLRRCIYEVEEYGIPIEYCDGKQEAEDFTYHYLKDLEEKYERDLSG